MVDPEQWAILMQGVEVWNRWRDENPSIRIELYGATLYKADLSGVNFREAILYEADLRMANLQRASLKKADLQGADLAGANLKEADLSGANCSIADLNSANLTEANLSATYLSGADLGGAILGFTIFVANDISKTKGLRKTKHLNSSSIGFDTIELSGGKIPVEFLRGCGLSDIDIEYSKLYNPILTNGKINESVYKIYDLRAMQAIQISPLFISYSHTDKKFVDKLDTALTKKGVRFWRDIHDATAGRLETQIDRAIRQNPTVLLVLSKNSIKCDWVEHEVRTARQLEKELGRDALCPIALDDGWKSSPWPKRVMEQVMEYNILDFSDWEDQSAFDGKFAKLLNGLDLFYKKAEE